MYNILILGAGFIGSRLTKKLKTSSGVTKVTCISQEEVDYTDTFTLHNFCESQSDNFDIVINACGYTGVPNVDACESNKHKCWALNTKLPVDLATYCNTTDRLFIHISSGCIYNGYEKDWTEEDTPNFGVFSNDSSFYSKSKHAAESLIKDSGALIFRIRMPFTMDDTHRNYLNKILQYDNIISMDNSVTCVEDFISMIINMIKYEDLFNIEPGVYNVVNPEPTCAEAVVEILKKFGLENPKWKVIPIDELQTKANRSNCVLSTEKLASIGHFLPSTHESLTQSISLLSKQIGNVEEDKEMV